MARTRRPWLTAVLVVGALVLGGWLIQVGLVLADAKKAGLLDEEKIEKYRVGRENNLIAIHKSLMQAAESDGAFPKADKWMETALIRLKTSDLTEVEAKDKLRVPGRTSGSFGYALNAAVSEHHPDDFKSKPDTVLVFESRSDSWNATGDPDKDGVNGGRAVTIEGKIVGG